LLGDPAIVAAGANNVSRARHRASATDHVK
jgi:hypothetical protein